MPRKRKLERRPTGCRIWDRDREYAGTVRVGRRVFQHLLSDSPTPERCVEGYHLHRTRFEQIAERKVRRRQLTEDGNVESPAAMSAKRLRLLDSASFSSGRPR